MVPRARALRRDALLQPGAGDAARRGDRGRADRRARAGARARDRRGDGQARDRRSDGPGFLVNRCGRPFGLEALRALQERLASVEEIDRIVRLGGGFRMGPFELQDLVGIDTGFEVSQLVLRAQLRRAALAPVAAERADGRQRPPRPQDRAAAGTTTTTAQIDRAPTRPPEPGGGDGRLVVIAGDCTLADDLRALAAGPAGTSRDATPTATCPTLIVDCGGEPGDERRCRAARCVLCAEGSLAALDGGGAAAGFHALPPLDAGGLVELDARPRHERAPRPSAARRSSRRWACTSSGSATRRGSCSGGSSASSSTRRRSPPARASAAPSDVDAGMELGLNHPRGPLAWGDEIGLDHVLARARRAARRARRSSLPRRAAAAPARADGRLGRATGSGFHDYE